MQLASLLIAVAFFCSWIIIGLMGSPQLDTPPGAIDLHYGRGLRLFALIAALAVATLMGYVVFFIPWLRPDQALGASAIFTLLNILSGLLLLETEKVRIVVTAQGIRASSPWRGRRELAWDAVQEMSYSSLNRWFVVTGPPGTTVLVSSYLVGVRAFLTMAGAHVPAERRALIARFIQGERPA